MTGTVSTAIKKTLKADSTTLINSLLHTQSNCTKLNEEEKIAAGFFALVDGPMKIGYGLMLMVAGVLLAPIPGVVATVSTSDVTDEKGTRSEVNAVGLKLRVPKTPFHSQRVTREDLGDMRYRQTKTSTLALHLNLRVADPEGTLPDPDHIEHGRLTRSKTTVTGYELASSGLGRVIVGAVDPIRGVSSALFYTGKKMVHKIKDAHERHKTVDTSLR